MNRPPRNSAGRRASELQRQAEFRWQCWTSFTTDRKGVTLPYSPEGVWILQNYARLWEGISQGEPQVFPSMSAQLPAIPEGRVLAVATLGDQASPPQSPEAPFTACSLPMKRGRQLSWESASEASASESALPKTELPQPVSDPAVASAPRPRRKRKKKGSSGPATLSPPAAESAGVPVPAAVSAGVPVPAAESAGVPQPAAESAGVPVPAAVSAGVPEPAKKKAVFKSAVVRAEERAAADSAAETLVQSVSSRKEMPVILAAKAFSDYLSRLVQILEVPVSPVLSPDPVPRSLECPAVVSPCPVIPPCPVDVVSPSPVDVLSPCPVSVAPCPVSVAPCPADVAPCPVDVPCPVVSPCPVDVVPPCPAVVSPRPVSVAPRPVSAPVMSSVSCPETPPHPSPPRPARTPRRQPSSCPPKIPTPPTHPGLSPMNFVLPPPHLPCLFFLICHPNPAIVYSCLPLLLFVMSCWFVSVSQSVMSRV
ncbi:uncharacterized protein LOC127948881 [Carassius gibelio]|uniref:uncharacterized protein LOC127948881 n=1 Tax=Carassius gibelio TaxID=101364 RepID=UPI002277C983|nr:uncharacterized protein LOC127948881 [Carassius gibelio]